MQEYLFCEIDGFAFFREREDELREEINSLTKEDLKNSDDSIKIFLTAKHMIKTIEFEDYYRVDKGEIDINVRNDRRFAAFYNRDINNKPVYRKGRLIEIHLPFSCDNHLFKIKPSSFTSIIPKAKISNELIFEFQFIGEVDKPEDFKKRINSEIDLTKKYASWLNQDINSFNTGIDSIINSDLKLRRKKLSKDEEFLDELDLPKKETEINIGFVRPEKKLKLKIIEEKIEKKEIKHILEEETYNEIIRYIDSLGVNLERSSQRVRDLDEESLRDTFLMALNSVYKGMVSGEAFNKSGKTDICIKHEDKNIFIAECKIWRGDEYFKEGLYQLFSYLTWRDSKTSYIIFSRNQDINSVIEKAKKLLTEQQNYVKEVRTNSESSIQYKFKQNNSNKYVFVNLHIFNLT